MRPPYSERTGLAIDDRFNGSNGLISFNSYSKKEKPWPKDLAPEAFRGLAGEVVNTILPHTEADASALLLNFLVAFSSVIGKSPHFIVSGTKNYLNINGVIVGDTSSARKGVSWGSIKEIFKGHSSEWNKDNLVSGLSSGEGLIWRVRDPIIIRETIKDKGKITGYQDKEADPGISDKRLLVVEPEFSRVLKATNREGNILSIIIREAFDSGDLSTLTKNTPAKSSGAIISILGHITKAELLKNLGETELANGFANRFIWMVVKKSKSLPEGGDLLPLEQIGQLSERLHQVVSFAQQTEKMGRDQATKVIWAKVYEELGKDKPGLFGAIVGRSQVLVARLSCLYALLDYSALVKPEHLAAALALWDRAEASIKYIFGVRMGDPVVDAILAALEIHGAMDQTHINELFGRNMRADRISSALADLHGYELVNYRKEDTGGRPRVIWSLGTHEHTN